jgi:putative membrane-bound dehydrogenase-like protein
MHALRLGFALFVLGCFAPLASAQLPPDKALASLQVPEGLQVELFAAEPMLINPTSMDIDEKGRVWVTEAVNYRRKNFGRPILRPEGDRIVILIDTDHDGKADESKVFYQAPEIYAPLGIAVAPYPNPKAKDKIGYKVFVCQSPDILLFDDADGDLKADGPPAKFLTGFQGFDHDHGVHGINIGPDGKLYFTVGDSGVKDLQSSDGKGKKFTSNQTDCRAGTVWRCDFDGKNLELIAHNFRNNYECCVNSFGDIWLSDNDDDGNQQTRICFVMPGGNYGYHPRGPGQSHWHEEQPGIVHKAMRTGFGSPTGICFYEGTLLPKKYQGQLLHTDAGPRELRCFHIKPKGAGFELEKENLITSTDNWFRLSDVCVAPDGSVLVCDWYDPGVGGHGMGDWTRGRVYRLTPKGHKGYKVPEVDFLGTTTVDAAKKSMLDLLISPNLATRSIGQNLALQAKLTLEDAASLPNQPVAANLVAAIIAQQNRKSDKETLTRINADMRKSAEKLRLPNTFAKHLLRANPSAIHVLVHEIIASNESLALKRDFLTAIPDSERFKFPNVLALLIGDYQGEDRFYLSALNIAVGRDSKEREWLGGVLDRMEWNDKVADLVWELRPPSMMPKLGKMLEDSKLTAVQKGRIVDILAASDDPASGKSLLGLLKPETPAEVRNEIVKNLKLFLPTKWASLKNDAATSEAINRLLAKPETHPEAFTLVSLTGHPEGLKKIVEVGKDATAPLATRKLAVQSLGQAKTAEALQALIEIGSPENPLSIDCIVAIGNHLPNNPKAPKNQLDALDALKRGITAKKATTELKSAALSTLAANRLGTQWLLEIAEQKQLPEELMKQAGQLLRNSPFQGERNKAMLLFPAPGKLDPKKLLNEIPQLAKRTGNASNGQKLLAATMNNEAQCLKCHMVRGQGGQIGPDLSMIGKKAAGKENLLESLLNPNKAIADQYLQYTIVTDSGVSVTGLIVQETETEVTVRDANGKDTKIPLKEIESKKKSLVSIMPDNLVNNMTEDELIDLTEYLLTLKTPSFTPAQWNIIGPFKNDGIDDKHPIESLSKLDLGATFDGKSGKITWKTVKPDSKGYLDLAAHYGTEANQITSYLTRTIESPKDQEAAILLGNDDECKLWLNGETVFTNKDHKAASPEQHSIKVKLKKGANTVLVKINNGNIPHGLYFTLTSEEEVK